MEHVEQGENVRDEFDGDGPYVDIIWLDRSGSVSHDIDDERL